MDMDNTNVQIVFLILFTVSIIVNYYHGVKYDKLRKSIDQQNEAINLAALKAVEVVKVLNKHLQ